MFKLADALEAIKDKPEFKVSDKGVYTVIDYQIEATNTFVGKDEAETNILLNLRGTAFDNETGKIISLPLHKFFNLNQKAGYMDSDLDFSKRESVMIKLDGSMIRPIPVSDPKNKGNFFVLATRAGVTDVSEMASKFLENEFISGNSRYHQFIHTMLNNNFTPIFEFTSRQNKVVIDYPEANLTLLAVRHNTTGRYDSYEQLQYLGKYYRIPIVQSFSEFSVENIRAWKDAEGVVVSFPDGFRVKLKADDYVVKHRAKDLVRFTKDVVELILTGKVDDVLPLLSNEVPEVPLTMADLTSERKKLEMYRDYLLRSIELNKSVLQNTFKEYLSVCSNKKEFALKVKDSPYARFFFRLYDGKSAGIEEFLLTNTSSSTKIKEALALFKIDPWSDL